MYHFKTHRRTDLLNILYKICLLSFENVWFNWKKTKKKQKRKQNKNTQHTDKNLWKKHEKVYGFSGVH